MEVPVLPVCRPAVDEALDSYLPRLRKGFPAVIGRDGEEITTEEQMAEEITWHLSRRSDIYHVSSGYDEDEQVWAVGAKYHEIHGGATFRIEIRKLI